MRLPEPIVLTAVAALVLFVVEPQRPLFAEEAVDGPALMQRVRDDIAWVGKLESFHLMARIEERRTPEGIAYALQQIKESCPDLEKPDPLKFTELLPETNLRLELDFDARRLRWMWLARDSTNRELSREMRMWDGRRVVYHDQNLQTGRERVVSHPDISNVAHSFWECLSYLNHQPLEFWPIDEATKREQLRCRYGTASDFVLVDRDIYHGVDCHVLLKASGGWLDRYYVGVKDGRWYGAKTDAAFFVSLSEFSETYQRLHEELLGKSLGAGEPAEFWDAVHQELKALSPSRRAEWAKRYYSELGKRIIPFREFWFSDIRDLGENRFLPFRENCLSYDHDDRQKSFVANQRTLFVRKLTLNQPLDDSLFDEPIAAGATVVDETAKP